MPDHYSADNPVMRHLARAVGTACEQLALENHLHRTTQEEFRGVSYLAGDPSIGAFCTLVENTHVVVVGAPWVFRLVKICDRLSEVLPHRPRAGVQADSDLSDRVIGEDEDLTKLLWGDLDVTETEANRIAQSWPSPEYAYTEDELGAWAVFYDLVRVVWYHEWAHALCGHIAVAQEDLHLLRLHESSTERATSVSHVLGAPTSEVLQNLEMHADEFSVHSNLGQILYGRDPAGLMVHTSVDLVDRMLHLNTAFCVFGLLWALEEEKTMTATARWDERSHPPVTLRYDRFRNFQRQWSIGYDDQLGPAVDAVSIGFLNDSLGDASPCFRRLLPVTPMFVRTPTMKDVERYESYLMRLEPAIAQRIERHGYLPKRYFESQAPERGAVQNDLYSELE